MNDDLDANGSAPAGHPNSVYLYFFDSTKTIDEVEQNWRSIVDKVPPNIKTDGTGIIRSSNDNVVITALHVVEGLLGVPENERRDVCEEKERVFKYVCALVNTANPRPVCAYRSDVKILAPEPSAVNTNERLDVAVLLWPKTFFQEGFTNLQPVELAATPPVSGQTLQITGGKLNGNYTPAITKGHATVQKSVLLVDEHSRQGIDLRPSFARDATTLQIFLDLKVNLSSPNDMKEYTTKYIEWKTPYFPLIQRGDSGGPVVEAHRPYELVALNMSVGWFPLCTLVTGCELPTDYPEFSWRKYYLQKLNDPVDGFPQEFINFVNKKFAAYQGITIENAFSRIFFASDFLSLDRQSPAGNWLYTTLNLHDRTRTVH